MSTSFNSNTAYASFGSEDRSQETYTQLRYSLSIGAESQSGRPILTCRVKCSGQDEFSECTFPPLPVQRWVNVTTTIKGRVMDVYVDGKLIKAHPLPGIPETSDSGPVYILGNTPEMFIHGRISRLQYMNKYITPKQAWDIYADGPLSSSFLRQFLNKYQLKIMWMVDNEAKWQATL